MPTRSTTARTTILGRLVSACAAVALIGCGRDVVAPQPAPDPTRLYWAVTLDQHALTLSTVSPYDTVRVTATPRNAAGAPLSGAPPITYTSSDLQHLQVSPDGLIRGMAPGQGISLIATLTAGNLTHADTALLDVTAVSAPPQLATLSIHPVPPDSAVLPMVGPGYSALAGYLYGPVFGGQKQVTPQAGDATGAPLSGLRFDFRSSDTTIATIDRQTGFLSGVQPGQVTLIASATAYGVVKADTVAYTITLPAGQFVAFGSQGQMFGFIPSGVTIVQGGYVIWWNGSKRPVDVVFDDSIHVAQDSVFCRCGAGNVTAFGDTTGFFSFANVRTRWFPVAGAYTYHSTLTGLKGTITVVARP